MRTSAGPSAIPSMPLPTGQARPVPSWAAPTAPMPPVPEVPPVMDEVTGSTVSAQRADEVDEVTRPLPKFTRPGWDAWALKLAEVIATRADCTRSQVGAIILANTHRAIGLGYNGLPPGVPGCATAGNCPRGQLTQGECAPNTDYANCAATHSERNAIEDALARPGGADALKTACLYVTREPCPACWTLIHAVGIHRVVTPTNKYRRDLESK